jgi:hypothetical protein
MIDLERMSLIELADELCGTPVYRLVIGERTPRSAKICSLEITTNGRDTQIVVSTNAGWKGLLFNQSIEEYLEVSYYPAFLSEKECIKYYKKKGLLQ